MNSIRRLAAVCLRVPGSLPILSGLLILGLMFSTSVVPGHAQQLTGTMSATVYDASGAVVPGATIVLKNAASGDIRRTVADSEGYFTFTAARNQPRPSDVMSVQRTRTGISRTPSKPGTIW